MYSWIGDKSASKMSIAVPKGVAFQLIKSMHEKMHHAGSNKGSGAFFHKVDFVKRTSNLMFI